MLCCTFGVVESRHSLLFCDVPHDEQVVCRGRGKQVGVIGAPAYGCDGLLVFRHDGPQFELIVLLVQLQEGNKNTCYSYMQLSTIIPNKSKCFD